MMRSVLLLVLSSKDNIVNKQQLMDRFPHRNREDLEAAKGVLDFDPQEETSGSDDAMDVVVVVVMSVNGDDETSSDNEDSDDAASKHVIGR
jgi:hypothetical protein